MNSFFKTNGPQMNMMKDIMNNFETSFLNENLKSEENPFDILRQNIDSLEDNSVATKNSERKR